MLTEDTSHLSLSDHYQQNNFLIIHLKYFSALIRSNYFLSRRGQQQLPSCELFTVNIFLCEERSHLLSKKSLTRLSGAQCLQKITQLVSNRHEAFKQIALQAHCLQSKRENISYPLVNSHMSSNKCFSGALPSKQKGTCVDRHMPSK